MPHKMKAIQLLHEGVIGQVYHGAALCYKRRFSSGIRRTSRCRPASTGTSSSDPRRCSRTARTSFAYNWHWFWDTGNGDIGNQGVHEMDISLWGLET